MLGFPSLTIKQEAKNKLPNANKNIVVYFISNTNAIYSF